MVYTEVSGEKLCFKRIQKQKRRLYCNVGFEVLTAVVMKNTVFWDITPYSPLKINSILKEHMASIFGVEE
jgi:hypothetical protein